MSKPWSIIDPDDVEIVDPDGKVRGRVKGYYGGTTFIIDDKSVDIRPGDEIRRKLPNGQDDIFYVTDPKYYGAFGGHYQVKFTRQRPTPKHAPTYNVNVSGHNARVNIDSTDHSHNTIQIGDVFSGLRQAISNNIADTSEKTALLSAVEEMNRTQKQPGFLGAYNAFISSAANHMTLIGPFLPALAALLTAH